MIRLMTGLQRPDSGSYTLYGVPYTDSGDELKCGGVWGAVD